MNSNIDIEEAIYKINLNRASKRLSKLFRDPLYKRIPPERIEDPRYLVDEQLQDEIYKKYYSNDDDEFDDFNNLSDYQDYQDYQDYLDTPYINAQPKTRMDEFPIYKKTEQGVKLYDINNLHSKQKSKSFGNYSNYSNNYKNSQPIYKFEKPNNYASYNLGNIQKSQTNYTFVPKTKTNKDFNLNKITNIDLHDSVVFEINHNGTIYTFEASNIDFLELESKKYSGNSNIFYDGKIQLSGIISVSSIKSKSTINSDNFEK